MTIQRTGYNWASWQSVKIGQWSAMGIPSSLASELIGYLDVQDVITVLGAPTGYADYTLSFALDSFSLTVDFCIVTLTVSIKPKI